MPYQRSSQLMDYYQSFRDISLIGLFSALASKAITVTILAPFNFVENRFQVMAQMKRNGLINNLYKGYIDCIMTAKKEQGGFRSLWKGNFAKVLFTWSGLAFSLTIGDYGKKQFKKMYKSNATDRSKLLTYLGNISGMLSSLASIFVTYPLEYAYVRLVADKQSVSKNGQKQFKSIRDVMKLTINTDGLPGLYRGVFTSFGGIALYRVSFYGLHDLRKSMPQKNQSVFEVFIASYLITLTSGFIVYPVSTIRKRMMMRSLESEKYQWSIGCLKHIVKKQGFLALYRGFPISVMTAISNSLFLVTYDYFMVPIH